MNPNLVLGLALALNSGLFCVQAADTNAIATANVSVVKIVNPQGSVDLPRLGHAIFREQFSSFSLQVPIGFRENGKRMDTNNPVLQVWLLKTDGTTIPQSDKLLASG